MHQSDSVCDEHRALHADLLDVSPFVPWHLTSASSPNMGISLQFSCFGCRGAHLPVITGGGTVSASSAPLLGHTTKRRTRCTLTRHTAILQDGGQDTIARSGTWAKGNEAQLSWLRQHLTMD